MDSKLSKLGIYYVIVKRFDPSLKRQITKHLKNKNFRFCDLKLETTNEYQYNKYFTMF